MRFLLDTDFRPPRCASVRLIETGLTETQAAASMILSGLLLVADPGEMRDSIPLSSTAPNLYCDLFKSGRTQSSVISSSDRPFVSGTTKTMQISPKRAAALKHQKVPSFPKRSCMIGKL